jgi:pilus assembly protein CpaF
MIKLTITEKGGEVRALSFDKDEVSIGRVQGNDIVLPKGNISKRHSRLLFANSRISISDLKSTNGTYVNGRKINESTVVKAGDKVFVGDFLIVIDPSAAAAEITGSRRGSPPPPPAPPFRAAPSPAAAAGFESNHTIGIEDLPGSGAGALGASRGRPPAPPPPPPKRTVVTAALVGDQGDLGFDVAPPSPLDIESKLEMDAADVADVPENGASAGAVDGDAEAEAEAERHRDARLAGGSVDLAAAPEMDSASLHAGAEHAGAEHAGAAMVDMFGSTYLTDEDAAFSAEFPAPLPDHAVFPPEAPLEAVGDLGDAPAPDDLGASEAPPHSGEAQPTPPPLSMTDEAPFAAAEEEAAAAGPPASDAQVLEELLLDPQVTAIVISPRGTVDVERLGQIESRPLLGEGNSIAERVWQLANTAVPPPPSDNPVVDVRLPDGTRVTALFPPITPMSVCAVIRKSTASEALLTDVCANRDVEQIVTAALAARRNILIAGDRPALTTLAGALAGALPAGHRVVGIGTGGKTRPGWIELGLGHDPASLVRAAAAFGADHLVVVEPHGGDLPDLLLAAARGQQGIVAAVAARSAAEALSRLEAFCVGAVGVEALTPLVLGTIDLILFAGAGPDGVVHIWEVAEPRAEGRQLWPAFAVRRGDGSNTIAGLEVSGISQRLADAIASVAQPVPAHLVRR